MKRTGESGESLIGSIIGLVIIAVLVWWGYNTFFKPDTYMAFYETPISEMPQTRNFDSKDECLNWIHDQQAFPGDRTNFECGSNCKPSNSVFYYQCEETFD